MFSAIVLATLIVVHELGHFVAAVAVGIEVQTFSIGFGPRLVGIRVGKTDFRFSAIPFGGYIRMNSEHGNEIRRDRIFLQTAGWERVIVLVAGPTMNIVLAIGLMTGLYLYGFPKQMDTTWPIVASINASSSAAQVELQPSESGEQNVRVGALEQASPAARAGLQSGDLLLTANGNRIISPSGVQRAVIQSWGQPLKFQVIRNGHLKTVTIIPAATNDPQMPWRIGISFSIPLREVKLELSRALQQSIRFNEQNAVAFLHSVGGMLTNRISTKSLSGPIGIARTAQETMQAGVCTYLSFIAFVSLQLAIFNLLPIPGLDGGMLLMMVIEILLLRREISQNVKETVLKLGCLLLLVIIACVMYNDLNQLLTEPKLGHVAGLLSQPIVS